MAAGREVLFDLSLVTLFFFFKGTETFSHKNLDCGLLWKASTGSCLWSEGVNAVKVGGLA